MSIAISAGCWATRFGGSVLRPSARFRAGLLTAIVSSTLIWPSAPDLASALHRRVLLLCRRHCDEFEATNAANSRLISTSDINGRYFCDPHLRSRRVVDNTSDSVLAQQQNSRSATSVSTMSARITIEE